MECRNGDDCNGFGVLVASWAADGGVGGAALKTVGKHRLPCVKKNRSKTPEILTDENQDDQQTGEPSHNVEHQFQVIAN